MSLWSYEEYALYINFIATPSFLLFSNLENALKLTASVLSLSASNINLNLKVQEVLSGLLGFAFSDSCLC